MAWAQSGRAWGERATDWAYLFEPYARRANDALFDQAQVGPGTRLLDIACGAGYAASVAAGRGAEVSGLDASEALITIARARTPAADFRVGDMFALPSDDGHFDVATSFNGIWKGCEDALIEARRVVRPDGLVGLTFWGSPRRMGLLPYFAALLELSPADHIEATAGQADTGRPGVAERMLADAFVGGPSCGGGLKPEFRGGTSGRLPACRDVPGSTRRSTRSWRNSLRLAWTSIGNVPVS
jgi:SAM-dependent methyltransferase